MMDVFSIEADDMILQHPGIFLELLTKSLVRGARRENRKKKDAYRRHPIHLIILFKFKAVAERRQWSSAASNPRRKTRVKLCPHF